MPMGIIDEEEKKGSQVLQELATEFLRKDSASAFLRDPEVKEIIESIGISFPVGPQPREINSPNRKLTTCRQGRCWLRLGGCSAKVLPRVKKIRKFVRKLPKQNYRGPDQTPTNSSQLLQLL